MIIDWNVNVSWRTAPIDMVTEAVVGSYQNYFYSEQVGQQLPDEPPRRRLLLSIADHLYDQIGQVVGNLYNYSGGPRLYEAQMIEHDAGRHPDHCMPSQAGYPHLRLIITGIAPNDAIPMMTLAEVIDLAPVVDTDQSGRKPLKSRQVVVNLSPAIWEVAQELATIYYGQNTKNMDDFIAMCIYNMAEDLL